MFATDLVIMKPKRGQIDLLENVAFKELFKSPLARDALARFINRLTHIEESLLRKADIKTGLIEDFENKKDGPAAYISLLDHNVIQILYFKLGHVDEVPKLFEIYIDKVKYYYIDDYVMHMQSRNEEGILEDDSYEAIHVEIENVLKDEFDEDPAIKKMITFLTTRDIEKMRTIYAGDEPYMKMMIRAQEILDDPNIKKNWRR